MLIKIMEYIERRSYKNADFITVLSEGGIDYIAKRGGKPLKIKHIYNGCTTPCLKDLKGKILKVGSGLRIRSLYPMLVFYLPSKDLTIY